MLPSSYRGAARQAGEVSHVPAPCLGTVDQGHRHSHGESASLSPGRAWPVQHIAAPAAARLRQWLASAAAALCLKG